jgi:serine phosphatase RsbU (regulator of sigma subunit)
MGTTSDLTDFGLGDLIRFSSALRALGPGSRAVEDYAARLCSSLYDRFRAADGERQAVLVRCYLTQPLAALPALERAFVRGDDDDTSDKLRCLTLLGTAGDRPEWNDRRRSKGHLAIGLHDAAGVASAPMIAGLLNQMGIDVAALVEPAGLVMDPSEHRFGVFYVPEAAGSPLIPAQDFVAEHGVRSVLGFGGVLPTGEMYAVVLFARVAVTRDIAHLLEALSPSITLALTDLIDRPVFTDHLPLQGGGVDELDRLRAREGLLRGLLEVHERVAALESDTSRAAVLQAKREAERSGNLARTLQASLLPLELPQISGLKSAAFFRPAGDGSEIGGDFYDLFPIRRGTWGLVLGDVSGKGAGAASLTALARHTVRTAALRARSSVEVLRVLNQAVYGQNIAEERYLTALFAFLTRKGPVVQVELCLGGHEAPVLLRPGQAAVEIGETGQPLGLFPQVDLARTDFVLQRHDSLVAFTDGVTEARQGREQFGMEQAEAVLTSLAALGVTEAVAGLALAVADYQGPYASDDIAIVGIQSRR